MRRRRVRSLLLERHVPDGLVPAVVERPGRALGASRARGRTLGPHGPARPGRADGSHAQPAGRGSRRQRASAAAGRERRPSHARLYRVAPVHEPTHHLPAARAAAHARVCRSRPHRSGRRAGRCVVACAGSCAARHHQPRRGAWPDDHARWQVADGRAARLERECRRAGQGCGRRSRDACGACGACVAVVVRALAVPPRRARHGSDGRAASRSDRRPRARDAAVALPSVAVAPPHLVGAPVHARRLARALCCRAGDALPRAAPRHARHSARPAPVDALLRRVDAHVVVV